MAKIKGVTDEVLEVHGLALEKKWEGVTRVIYENPDGFNSQITRNEKLENAKDIIDDLEADVVAYSEHRLNSKHKDNITGPARSKRGNLGPCPRPWSVVVTDPPIHSYLPS